MPKTTLWDRLSAHRGSRSGASSDAGENLGFIFRRPLTEKRSLSALSLPQRLALVGIAALTLAIRVALALISNYTSEDAYITFRYARNLVNGAGFVYNEGARVLGTTTPALTLFLAGAGTLRFDWIWCAKAAGITADVISTWLVFSLARDLTKSGRWALLSAFLFSTSGPAAVWSVSGMETALFTLSVLLTLAAFAAQRNLGVALGCSLAILIRPEGLLLEAVVIALMLLESPPRALRVMGFTALLVAPWVVWSYAYFGDVVPMSVQAKAALYGSAWNWKRLVSDFVNFVLGVGYAFQPNLHYKYVLADVCGWLTFAIFLTGLAVSGWRRRQRAAAFLFFSLYVPYSFVSFPFAWYWVPLTPLAALFVTAGCAALVAASPRRVAPAVAAFVCGVVIAVNVLVLPDLSNQLKRWRHADRSLFEASGVWLQSNTAANSVVCTEHIGYIGYFSQRTILDTSGLVSPEVVAFSRRMRIRYEPLRTLELLRSGITRCDYFVISADMWEAMLRIDRKSAEPILATLFTQVVAFDDTSAPTSSWYPHRVLILQPHEQFP